MRLHKKRKLPKQRKANPKTKQKINAMNRERERQGIMSCNKQYVT